MIWRVLFKDNILQAGQDYVNRNAVNNYVQQEKSICADVSGLEDFHVEIQTEGDMIAKCLVRAHTHRQGHMRTM